MFKQACIFYFLLVAFVFMGCTFYAKSNGLEKTLYFKGGMNGTEKKKKPIKTLQIQNKATSLVQNEA